jgi:hydrogenase large subunit
MISCCINADLLGEQWNLLLANMAKGDLKTFNKPEFPKGEVMGVGFHEAPRGALSHWVVIDDGKIKNYQCVVPSTWNACPRNDKDEPGPYEASLLGNPIADPEKPLEVLRTVHSFDPCIACAIHLTDTENGSAVTVKVK